MTLQQIQNEGWIQTDPDAMQFRKNISDTQFRFRQWNESFAKKNRLDEWDDANLWHDRIIDLTDYSEKEIEDHISSFGYSIVGISFSEGRLKGYKIEDDSANIYDLNSSQELIAECIFETEVAEYADEDVIYPETIREQRVYFVRRYLVNNPSHFSELSKHSDPAAVIAEFNTDAFHEEREEFIEVAENNGHVVTIPKFMNLLNNRQYDFDEFYIYIS